MNARTRLLPALLLISGAWLAAPTELPAQVGDFDSALERYKTCMRRLPFLYHTQSRRRLASTRDPRALKILCADYARSRAYPEFTRYTVATLLGDYFNDPDSIDAFGELRASHKEPRDAWMWVRTLKIDAEHKGGAATLAEAREATSIYMKAAAVEALARAGDPEVLKLLPALCAALPKKPGARRLMIGPMSAAILANKHDLQGADMQKAIRAYIGLLAKEIKLDHSTKILIARHLSKTFARNSMYIEPEPWLRMLERSKETGNTPTGHTVSTIRFFGIEAEGDRVCYVIDMSDSMCKKIDPGMKKAKGPLTGPRKKRKKRKKGVPPDESDIPWEQIETRFDLAREFLKISLLRLTKEKRFAIVWFGDGAGTLSSCKGMIKATRGNVRKVIRELESIETGKPVKDIAPDGKLRGRTNMHAGLRRAFALRAKGFAKTDEHVDEKALALGCDTIFLLSDGAPSWDDFGMRDKDYGEGKVVKDQEYGEAAPRTPFLTYPGPFSQGHWVLEDVRRLNVFRKAQIHCIGIGEANLRLLEQIASETMGETFVYGKEAKRRAGK